MGRARVDLPATAATGWPRPAVGGQPRRRIRRRWRIERFFAWLHNSRRVVTRWERHLENYLDMVQLAYAQIQLRAFMR
jgi:transposase